VEVCKVQDGLLLRVNRYKDDAKVDVTSSKFYHSFSKLRNYDVLHGSCVGPVAQSV